MAVVLTKAQSLVLLIWHFKVQKDYAFSFDEFLN